MTQKDTPITDEENSELTEDFFKNARPAKEVLSSEVYNAFLNLTNKPIRMVRSGHKSSSKKNINISLDQDIIEHFMSTDNKHWKNQLNSFLREKLNLRNPE